MSTLRILRLTVYFQRYTILTNDSKIGGLRESWYEHASRVPNFTIDQTIQYREMEIKEFGYRRHVRLFKTYWHHAGRFITKLSMMRCSFECDGFRFILDHCPVLETLEMNAVKLRDLDDFHTTGKSREGAPVSYLIIIMMATPSMP